MTFPVYSLTGTSTPITDGQTVYPNNYEYSDIRAWLNEVFYETAFTELQQAIIETTTVDNSARSTNPQNNATAFNSGTNTYACANTQDKVFLLSEQEVTNSAYGFNASYSASGNDALTCQKKTTDYAKANGAWTSTDSSYAGNGRWWLRSPHYHASSSARVVFVPDRVYTDSDGADKIDGVVPALQIRL